MSVFSGSPKSDLTVAAPDAHFHCRRSLSSGDPSTSAIVDFPERVEPRHVAGAAGQIAGVIVAVGVLAGGVGVGTTSSAYVSEPFNVSRASPGTAA